MVMVPRPRIRGFPPIFRFSGLEKVGNYFFPVSSKTDELGEGGGDGVEQRSIGADQRTSVDDPRIRGQCSRLV